MVANTNTHYSSGFCRATVIAFFTLVLFYEVMFAVATVAATMDDFYTQPYQAASERVIAASGSHPNLLFILDNSGSMILNLNGEHVGGASGDSRSEIARHALKDLLNDYKGKINAGLMSYAIDQDNIELNYLSTFIEGARYSQSANLKYKYPNPTNAGSYVFSDKIDGFFSESPESPVFCYAQDDPVRVDHSGGDHVYGPYRCFDKKDNNDDRYPNDWGGNGNATNGEKNKGYKNFIGVFTFYWFSDGDVDPPDFQPGTLAILPIDVKAWRTDLSPGYGYLHIPIDELDQAQLDLMISKLATEQYSSDTDTPLRNTGDTPMVGTLRSAYKYFKGTLSGAREGGPAAAPVIGGADGCAGDYVVLVTDGMPSADANGQPYDNYEDAVADVEIAAAELLSIGIKTFIVGFALDSVDANETSYEVYLNRIATAGGTEKAFLANNAGELSTAFDIILQTTANQQVTSLGGLSYVSNDSRGVGVVVTPIFQPTYEDDAGNVVRWVGDLGAMFVDSAGNFREDNANDGVAGQLDGCNIDKIVRFKFDNNTQETTVTRFNATEVDGVCLAGTPSDQISLSELNRVWNAQSELARIARADHQRAYNANANLGRYIFTSIDGEVLPFTTVALSDAQKVRLGVAPTEVDNVINFVRGVDGILGMRPRHADLDGDGTTEVLRLGDIVYSSAVTLGRPSENYSTRYGDESYAAFVKNNHNRRQVVYVGANDGMIHAFNAGFWNASGLAFETQVNGLTKHPLGSELWAYVPENLLPHLQWLTREDYKHVSYMDGSGKIFDVKLGDEWHSLLVMGMRLGGGPMGVTLPDGSVKTSRSAYVILDVTDPEAPPVFIDEVTHETMGYTLSEPVLIRRRSAGETSWHLVFGSGPNSINQATSSQPAHIYEYSLSAKAITSVTEIPGTTAAFVAGLHSVDWDGDFADDIVYVSVNEGTDLADIDGRLVRYRVDNKRFDTLLVTDGKPFSSAVTTAKVAGQHWVYAGTGRLYLDNDLINQQTQSLIGVKEPLLDGQFSYAQVPFSQLVQSNTVTTYSDGSVTGAPFGIESYTEWVAYIEPRAGWRYQLETPLGSRTLATPSIFTNQVLFTVYNPPTEPVVVEPCSVPTVSDSSDLYSLGLLSGIPHFQSLLGSVGYEVSPRDVGTVAPMNLKISLGAGATFNAMLGGSIGGGLSVTYQGTKANPTKKLLKVPKVPASIQSWRMLKN